MPGIPAVSGIGCSCRHIHPMCIPGNTPPIVVNSDTCLASCSSIFTLAGCSGRPGRGDCHTSIYLSQTWVWPVQTSAQNSTGLEVLRYCHATSPAPYPPYTGEPRTLNLPAYIINLYSPYPTPANTITKATNSNTANTFGPQSYLRFTHTPPSCSDHSPEYNSSSVSHHTSHQPA